MTKAEKHLQEAEKHLQEAEKAVKKARRHLARILIDECEGSEPLRESRPGLRHSENLLVDVLDEFRREKYLTFAGSAPVQILTPGAQGAPMSVEEYRVNLAELAERSKSQPIYEVGEDGVQRRIGGM